MSQKIPSLDSIPAFHFYPVHTSLSAHYRAAARNLDINICCDEGQKRSEIRNRNVETAWTTKSQFQKTPTTHVLECYSITPHGCQLAIQIPRIQLGSAFPKFCGKRLDLDSFITSTYGLTEVILTNWCFLVATPSRGALPSLCGANTPRRAALLYLPRLPTSAGNGTGCIQEHCLCLSP
ncbi:uncharacterized protein N7479_011359 [Penicillium vulpinum]|uniref:Uncharacterized protein n=1 Tax=Penicillium vulpinum TaxID=29845 RepID=A0A1V6RXC9_9EURO|nr:uncharacterized protein N7479_011359 [Penicillium vulpinum]KAJ5952946.1 hypothetical protein N7479_011359 [Penicillium vulpinum]OQE06431.1 hypothetical protein PENVUL_c018G03688 [Penicillium vulpinum]